MRQATFIDVGAALDEHQVRAVRSEVERLVGLLREAAGGLTEDVSPKCDGAALHDWVSIARLTYDCSRDLVHFMTEAASAALTLVAWEYEQLLPVLDAQITVAEAV